MRVNFLFIFIIVFFFIMAMYAGNEKYIYDTENNIDRNIQAYSNEIFNWSNSSNELATQQFNNMTTYNMSDIQNQRFKNIIYKITDAIGYSFMEYSKIGFEYGYAQEGEYNGLLIIKFLKIVMWIIVIGFLIYPGLILGFLIYESIRLTKKHIKKYRLKKNNER